MAVLTEAIEAERGAGAAKATAVGLVVNATETSTVLVVTFTAVVDGLALDLGLLLMIAITAPRAAPVGMSGMKTDGLAVSVKVGDEAQARKVTRGLRNLLRMNVTGVQSSSNSLLHG